MICFAIKEMLCVLIYISQKDIENRHSPTENRFVVSLSKYVIIISFGSLLSSNVVF